MLKEQRIVFIGPGVMAEAMVGGLVERAGVAPGQIRMSGPRQARLQELESRYGVQTTGDNRAAVEGAGVVVVAVKPQSLKPALEAVQGAVPKEALVLSIVAGAPLAQLTRLLEHPAVVRAMPNTPAQIGEGMTVWTATPEVSDAGREGAGAVFGALGKEAYVPEERYLDMATGLSGSGPAYVFLFIEALADAGVHIGLSRELAATMALQTVLGSARYAEATKRHPAALRNQVTSPGGTTVEALRELEAAGFRAAVLEAVIAAYEKSKALGQETN